MTSCRSAAVVIVMVFNNVVVVAYFVVIGVAVGIVEDIVQVRNGFC